MLSKRERILTWATGATIAAFVVNAYIVEPLTEGAKALEERRLALEGEVRAAENLIDTQPRLEERWREMIEAGLTSNAAHAEAQVFSLLREWAEEARLSLSLIKPQRAAESETLTELRFVASCEGNMRAVTRLLFLIESAQAPVRIEKIQLVSRKEGEDDLTLTLHLSTVYRNQSDSDEPNQTANTPTLSQQPVSGEHAS